MFQNKDNQLYAEFIFKDFIEAFSFIAAVSMVAEKQGHHPTWTNTWNKVEIYLSTHDAGGVITNKDKVLAKAIEEIYQKYST